MCGLNKLDLSRGSPGSEQELALIIGQVFKEVKFACPQGKPDSAFRENNVGAGREMKCLG